MVLLPSTLSVFILGSLWFRDAYCHNSVYDSSLKNHHPLQSFLKSDNSVREFSPGEIHRLFRKIPPVDHVVLFYINLNRDCRNFFPLFSQLYNDFLSEGRNIRFIKFNCQGVDRRMRTCQEYNINVVPTIAYVSSYPLQRSQIPPNSYVRRFLRFIFFDKNSDINLENATRYKGDIFAYDQLRDWVSLMYNISTANRMFGSPESFFNTLRSFWLSFISFFKRGF